MDAVHQPAGGRLIRGGAVIYGADREVCQWVAKRIPDFEFTPRATALGIVAAGKLVAGIVYDNFNGFHVQASIAARPGSRWASRDTLHRMFAYPFLTLGCEAVTVTVPMTNLESLNLATKLGFKPQCYIKFAAFDGSPLVVLQAYRDTCRWLIDRGSGESPGSTQPQAEPVPLPQWS